MRMANRSRGGLRAVLSVMALVLVLVPINIPAAQAAVPTGVTISVSPLTCSIGYFQVFDGSVELASTATTHVVEIKANGSSTDLSGTYVPGQKSSGQIGIDPALAPGTAYTITVTVDGQLFGTPVTGTAPDCYPVGITPTINGPTCLADGTAGFGYKVVNANTVDVTTLLNGAGHLTDKVVTSPGSTSVVEPLSYFWMTPGEPYDIALQVVSGFYLAEKSGTWPDCSTPPPPVDVCKNIDGNQATVPPGMVVDAAGNCTTPPPPPVDVCKNIDGNQATVPPGMVVDAAGNCTVPVVTPPPVPTVAVKVWADKKQSKLKVDVDPNLSGKKYWKFKVQYKKADGSWANKKTCKTAGKSETKTVNLKKGTYRVLVLGKYGLAGNTSTEVYLKK